jgi:hypothetical protein
MITLNDLRVSIVAWEGILLSSYNAVENFLVITNFSDEDKGVKSKIVRDPFFMQYRTYCVFLSVIQLAKLVVNNNDTAISKVNSSLYSEGIDDDFKNYLLEKNRDKDFFFKNKEELNISVAKFLKVKKNHKKVCKELIVLRNKVAAHSDLDFNGEDVIEVEELKSFIIDLCVEFNKVKVGVLGVETDFSLSLVTPYPVLKKLEAWEESFHQKLIKYGNPMKQ